MIRIYFRSMQINLIWGMVLGNELIYIKMHDFNKIYKKISQN